jgi:hypothetical protein
LLNKKADLFIRNYQCKTPFTSITNNLLMIKLLKKAEVFQCIELIADSGFPKEAHLIDVELMQAAVI